MTDSIEAYPLTWPQGWHRTEPYRRTRASFGTRGQTGSWTNAQGQRIDSYGKKELSIAAGTARALKALEQMGHPSDSVVISSNLALRNDGLPRSNQRSPDDPGVAVYWGHGRNARCIAVDRYDRIADNLGAIAATLDAMRAIERHGGAAILDRAFTGFTALPAPEQPFQVLGVSANAGIVEIEDAYRKLASKHHPDKGGDASQMARINAARDALLNP